MQSTGQLRHAMFYLVIVMIFPILVLTFKVDHQEGMRAAGRVPLIMTIEINNLEDKGDVKD